MNNFVRFSVLAVAFTTLTAQSPAPESGADQAGSFCTRLGRSIGLSDEKLAGDRTGWEVNALNIGQRLLFGGSATTSMGVEPIEPVSVEGYKRADQMCASEGKGAVCRLVGPMNFKFGWKGKQSETIIRNGEAAVVKVEGTKSSCRNGATE